MSVRLTRPVTKQVLAEAIKKRVELWNKMLKDSEVSVESLYEELCCSIFSGDEEYDFPKLKPEDIYLYDTYGGCYFIHKGVVFQVADVRNMRDNPDLGKEPYYDICILLCDHRDLKISDDDCTWYHIVGGPGCYLFGSTSDNFNEGNQVHSTFVKAADEYIQSYGLKALLKGQEQ